MPVRLVGSTKLGNFPGVLILEKEGIYCSPPLLASREYVSDGLECLSLLPMISYAASVRFKFVSYPPHSTENIYTEVEEGTEVVHRDMRNLTARVSVLEQQTSPRKNIRCGLTNKASCASQFRNEITISMYNDECLTLRSPEHSPYHLRPAASYSPRRGDSKSNVGPSFPTSQSPAHSHSSMRGDSERDDRSSFPAARSAASQSPRRGDSSDEGGGKASRGSRGYEMLAHEIEPYPLPEPPGLLLLEPLLLVHDVTEETKRARRRKEQLSPSEQQKVARIMIAYTLAFFLLAILTFYVVYFV